MTRPIAVLDVETTGTKPDSDRIIDLAVVYVVNGSIEGRLFYRFNPGVHIPAEATAVHGIKDEDVLTFPPFKEAAAEIAKLFAGADLAGYAPRLLDLPILAAEFERAEVDWDFQGQIIDVRGIWMKMEPRDLTGAVKHFLGVEHSEAHNAIGDSVVTASVLLAQVEAHPELARMRTDELARFSQQEGVELVDLAGRLYRDIDGDLCFAFGKERGRKVKDRRSYAHWMLQASTPPFGSNTIRVLRAELDRLDGVAVKETTGGKDQPILF